MKATRILQVVGRMNRCGVETWLMHVLRNIDRERYQLDFLVHTIDEGAYDSELKSLGSRTFYCGSPSDPLRYGANLSRILRAEGPYDAIHTHVHYFGGYCVKLAHDAGVPVRICQSHNDSQRLDAQASLARRLYLRLCRSFIHRHATHLLAVSTPAGQALFGPAWRCDPRNGDLFCGLELAPYLQPVERAAVRARVGLAGSDLVAGHVGRFEEQKNHEFLLQAAAHAMAREPRLKLLLLGDGSLQPEMRARAAALGIADRVVFAGNRPDVPELLLGAVDVFAFPSRYEGLGLAAVEAQAAGLPSLLSDRLPASATWRPEAVRVLSLASPEEWAAELLAAAGQRWPARIAGCPFTIDRSLRSLEALYSAAGASGAGRHEAVPRLANAPQGAAQ